MDTIVLELKTICTNYSKIFLISSMTKDFSNKVISSLIV